MMNNRLNKLTASLEYELNYFSRQPGKSGKSKKYHGSPLLTQPPNPNLILHSRCVSKSSTPHFLSHSNSIRWEEDEDSQEILIVEEPEQQSILIVEKEEDQLSQQQELKESYQPPYSPEKKEDKVDRESPIYILEEDDNLLWINEDQFKNIISPYVESSEIRIQQEEQEQEQEENNPGIRQYIEQRVDHLGEIQQLSQEDISSSSCSMHPHIPISPQTTQPIQNRRLSHPLTQLEEQYWITQEHIDNNSIEYSQPHQMNRKQQKKSHSQLPTEHSYQRLLDQHSLKEILTKSQSKPFDRSLQKVNQLKEDIAPRTLHSISQMQSLIENDSSLVSTRLRQQEGTINILKTLLFLHIKPPFPAEYLNPQTIALDYHIQINQKLIHLLSRCQHK